MIDAQQYKVYPGTEERVYHDSFYQSLSLVVNALDNVEARRYIDGCVTLCTVCIISVWRIGCELRYRARRVYEGDDLYHTCLFD